MLCLEILLLFPNNGRLRFSAFTRSCSSYTTRINCVLLSDFIFLLTMLCLRVSYKLEGEGAWATKGQISKPIAIF